MQANFFIIGAPKCGTTALSSYLRQHLNVFVSHPKEPNYFCDDFNKAMRTITTLTEYSNLFAEANETHIAIGEASVWYLYSKKAIKNIFDYNPNAKIIVMLRNPVDLVYSMHAQDLNAVDEDQQDFEKSWRLQDDRLRGINVPKHCRDTIKLQYRDVGKLGEQLSRVLDVFSESQVKVIFFEDFTANTEQIFNKVLQFLEVPKMKKSLKFEAVNKNTVDRSRVLAVFYRRPPKKLVEFFMWLKKVLGIEKWGIMNKLVSINLKVQARAKLKPKFRKELIEYFSSDIQKLSKLTARDLSNWQ